MWKWLSIPLVMVFLVGCSITIDQGDEGQQDQTSKPEKIDPSIELTDNEDVDLEASFNEVVEGIFQIQIPYADQQETIEYLALGDSLTRGIGDQFNQFGYTGRLSKEFEKWPGVKEVILDNRGKNGRRSDQLLALLERGHYDEELQEANFISISIGGNDVMKIVKKDLFDLKESEFIKELARYEERYKQIIDHIRLQNPTVPIMLVGFYNPFEIVTDESTAFEMIIDNYNASIEDIAEADVNACFVPVHDLFESNMEMVYHTDFFHPNARGYEFMTERIIDKLMECGIDKMSEGALRLRE